MDFGQYHGSPDLPCDLIRACLLQYFEGGRSSDPTIGSPPLVYLRHTHMHEATCLLQLSTGFDHYVASGQRVMHPVGHYNNVNFKIISKQAS